MISDMEKGFFEKLFNRNGYVLDFSTANFDIFTIQSVGVALCSKYHLSKGKSLHEFLWEANASDVSKLLSDLLSYYEAHFGPEYDDSQSSDFKSYRHEKGMKSVYKKCREIIDREQASNSPFLASAEYIKQEFSSEHMDKQIELLLRMRTESPYDAIGKAKELIESCCKTILERQGVVPEKSWSVSQLTKKTAEVLDIDSKGLTDNDPSGPIVKKILGSLRGLASGVAEFRNMYGSGHGKSATFQELPARHAKLAVGSSLTLVEYFWETYEWRKSQHRLK